ncbi:hypothetical protein HNQ68_001412 [Pseudochrobactrum saccharolyticum]|uniref:Uncharacterized protein n=1 Tax=Pseudochrobactrum saccharolyticum TaxID=354352 RepID=A0A7W8AIC4_9HYPH|nr:hypothetical protein [Pseudochrobactrum saccharolyticum]
MSGQLSGVLQNTAKGLLCLFALTVAEISAKGKCLSYIKYVEDIKRAKTADLCRISVVLFSIAA